MRNTRNAGRLIVFGLCIFLALCFIFFYRPYDAAHLANPQSPRKAGKNVNIPKAATLPPNSENERISGFFSGAPPVKCGPGRFSPQEVGTHSSASDLWITVNEMVLNITDFIPAHPGGPAILQGAGGKDAADLFIQFHQPSTVGLFQKFCIGHLAHSAE